jgi:hypothetical protein
LAISDRPAAGHFIIAATTQLSFDDAGSYSNQSIGSLFSEQSSAVLPLPACQKRRIKLFEVVRANLGDTGLRAQFDQAV